MSIKRALIVDDSKTAQARLRKLLDRYDLEVDTIDSAEEALSYLSYKLPAVIFMDHLMTGMDGFEALKIIKSNPDTAMIPIVMYTSKKGDVYIGQARALGAIDVLSKDVIEPSDLDRVLGGISILAKGGQAKKRKPPLVRPASLEDKKKTNLDSVREQIARLLEIHIAKIRQEVSDNSRLMIKRLSRELKELKNQKDATAAQVNPELVVPQSYTVKQSGFKWHWAAILFGVLIVLSLLSYYQIYHYSSQQTALNENYKQLNEFVETQFIAVYKENAKLQDSLSSNSNNLNSGTLLNTLAWLVNTNSQFEFGELALGEERLLVIRELVSRLHAANFKGTIKLDVHFGDFCVISNANGEFVLPSTNSKISDCELLSNQAQEFFLQEQQSLSFANFVLNSSLLKDSNIKIEMRSRGMKKPVRQYPSRAAVKKAGEWNEAAKFNNRLHVEIKPK